MGNEIFIENKKVCIQPLRNRLEAIQKLQPQRHPKDVELCRKGGSFNWGKEQQDSFEEIKCRLIKSPVLNMPNKTGRFHLYSDTSKFATSCTLYQIQMVNLN